MPDAILTRRQFLHASALLGLGLILPRAAVAAVPAGVNASAGRDRTRVERTRFLMGTFVTMAVSHPSAALAEDAVEAAFAEMERLCSLLDRHRADTPLSHLNRHGSISDAPPELPLVAVQALRIHGLTDGAFDPTVLPLVALLESRSASTPGGPAPSLAEIHEALGLVDAGAVSLSPRAVRLGRQGMALTFDGIAKGYIVDRASETLSGLGATDHLINAGGDIRCSGGPLPGRPWTIAIEDPAREGRYPAVIRLYGGAVATSGSYETAHGAHGALHHIVDPRLGACPARFVSTSVTAPTAMEADALATGLFVLPPARALALAESLPRHACLLISSSGAQARSRGWSALEAG